MAIDLERPPLNEERKEWADWYFKIFQIISDGQAPVKTDSTRGDAGQAGRVIFNSDDGNLNIDTGTDWILPDGTIT
jgi:hypothetical protein